MSKRQTFRPGVPEISPDFISTLCVLSESDRPVTFSLKKLDGFTNTAHNITEVELTVMGNSKNLRVFNYANLLESRKFDVRKIHVFYSITGWVHVRQSKRYHKLTC